MAVFDALRYLSEYLKDSHPVNHLADLYELVQYAGNIIPRLYLMITVGTVYMAVEDAPVKEIMKDMMEMSRGVQHPIRGLFIRYYLSGQARDYLPSGTEDGPQGNLTDSINFILTNFVEMNKLWVRWQHQGHSREREQRTQERRELELLVGSNLVRLSQLVDLETYKNMIIVPLLEQVVQCRDVLAQEYLLEVITKVFPDEYHLHTLDQMLSAIARLNPHVDMKKIVIGLMDRLSTYAQREAESGSPEEKQMAEEDAITELMEKVRLDKEKMPATPSMNAEATDSTAVSTNSTKPESEASTVNGSIQEPGAVNGDSKPPVSSSGDVKLYEIFYEQVVNLVKTRGLTIQDTMALLTSLVNLALNIYPEKLEYVDQVLSYASEKAAEYTDSPDLHSAATQANMLSLLLSPIKTYFSLFTALALPNYLPLFSSQSYATRRSVAGEVAKTILRSRIKITTTEHLEGVLSLLRVIIKEGIQQPGGYPGLTGRQRGGETDETIEEQGWLARIVHMLAGADNDTQLKLIQQTKRAYEAGNERIKYTTPALITSSMKLARKYKLREHFDDDWKTQSSTLYRFMHQTLTQLYTRVNPGSAELCLRLFVACGQIADQSGFEEFAYEFFAQAFTIYEDSISDSRLQFQAVCILAGALQTTRGFGKENYDTLITKAALHGSKLLKKPDQCRAVYLASHLWWAIPIQNLPPKDEEDEESGEDTKNVSAYISSLSLHSPTYPSASSTATASACSNACSAPSALRTPAWTRQCQSSSSSKSSTATSTTSTSRTRRSRRNT
jgi:vacuolar protein sorting-associated protein 35